MTVLTIPESRAVICLDCRAIRDVSVMVCPCSSTHFWPLARWTEKRKEHVMVTYACMTEGCDFEADCDYMFTENVNSSPLGSCPKCGGREFISPPSAKTIITRPA